MRRKIVYFFIIFFANSLFAQDDATKSGEEYVNSLKIQLDKKDKLERKKKDLEDSLKLLNKTKKDLESLSNSLKKDIKKINNQKFALNEKKKELGYSNLVREKEQLIASISQNEINIKKELEILENFKQQLKKTENEKTQLIKVKNEISTRFITRYNGYVESSFSRLTIDSLRTIVEECKPYITDKNINNLVVKTETTINNKRAYDNAVNVVNTIFSRVKVFESQNHLANLQKCSPIQQKEISELRTILLTYEDGLNAFKEFINNLNETRKQYESYSLQFFEADKEIIFKNKLETRINNKLLKVPYLKSRYNDFIKEFKANPSGHYDVEKEILETK